MAELGSRAIAEALDVLASPGEPAAAGVASAITAAAAAGVVELAAGLAEMTAAIAGASADPAGAERLDEHRSRAGELRGRALELADRELSSYRPVLEAIREAPGPAERDPRVGELERPPAQLPGAGAVLVEPLGADRVRGGAGDRRRHLGEAGGQRAGKCRRRAAARGGRGRGQRLDHLTEGLPGERAHASPISRTARRCAPRRRCRR